MVLSNGFPTLVQCFVRPDAELEHIVDRARRLRVPADDVARIGIAPFRRGQAYMIHRCAPLDDATGQQERNVVLLRRRIVPPMENYLCDAQ